MHRVWRALSEVSLHCMDGHLWIQLRAAAGGKETNILGNGTFKVFAREGDGLVERDNMQMDIEGPARVVLFTQSIPALTTIKIFDKENTMRFHLVSEEDVEIQ